MGRSSRYLGGMAAVAATAAMLVPGSALAADGFTSGVTAGEVTDALGDRLGSRQPPGLGASSGRHGRRRSATWSGSRVVQATRRQRQHGPDHVRPASPQHHLSLPLLLLDGSPCSAVGRFLTAPSPVDQQDDQVRLLGRRDRPVPRPDRPSRSGANFKAFKSMVGRAQRLQHRLRRHDLLRPGGSRARRPPSTVPQKWGMYRKKLAVPNMQEHPRGDRALQPLGRPRVHQRLLRSPRTDARSTTGACEAFRDLRAGHLQRKTAASTGPSAGARTCSCSSSTSARSEAPRRRRTTSATTRDTGQPDLAPTAPQSTRNAVRGARPLPLPAGLAGLQGQDQQPEPHLPRHARSSTASSATVKSSNGEVEGGHERDPDPAVLRPALRPLGGLRVRARAAAASALQTANVDHLVFLTTDTHAALANVVRYRTLPGDVAPANAPADRRPRTRPTRTSSSGPVGDEAVLAGDRRRDGQPRAAAS